MDAAMSCNNSFEESPRSSHSIASRRHSGSTTGLFKEEQKDFLAQIAATEHKSAILALSPDHYQSFIPRAMHDGYPVALAVQSTTYWKGLRRAACRKFKIEITVSSLQCDLVEETTRDQSRSCGSVRVVAV